MWEGAALYIGPLADVAAHKHHAAQVSFGLSGPFRIRVGSDWVEAHYAAIPANIRHQLTSNKTPVAVALFDGATAPGRAIARHHVQTGGSAAKDPPDMPDDFTSARIFLNYMIAPQSARMPDVVDIDARIEKIMKMLVDVDGEQLRARDLALEVGLSEGRFLHLFTQNVGLPLRRYILWPRIIKSVGAASGGADLTTAAHIGGFSDSAHFSRVFRETFGLSPSKLFKNSRNIQVFTTL